jgi:glycosyltransferase involved in cell wall biosynthesis
VTSRIRILEWRHTGHRLAYVAAIVRSVPHDAAPAILETSAEAAASVEYAEHLLPLEQSGTLIRDVSEIGTGNRALVASLRRARKLKEVVVLPEADRVLPVLAAVWLTRGLPRPTSIIVMRPPQWRDGGVRALPWALTKAALLTAFALATGSFDVHLLEDPLAGGPDRVWRWPFESERLRLNDPSDLVNDSDVCLPPELLGESRPMIAVVGAIDERKNLPLILAAWHQTHARDDSVLVIAGRHSSEVRNLVASEGPGPSIISIDRYLSNAEMAAVLHACRGLFVLHDGGISSGLLTKAASLGRWVIALEGSRTGRTAKAAGVGEIAQPTPIDLARAIDSVVGRMAYPPPVSLDTAHDFGRRVLRTFVASTRGRAVR